MALPQTLPNAYTDSAAPSAALPPFFAVSLRKFALLSVCTLGLYHLYWFYRHWQHVRAWSSDQAFSPARRTLLFFLYGFVLFARVRALDLQANGRSGLRPVLLGLGYIAANAFDLLPAPFWLLSLFGFVFLLPVQSCANRLNEQLCATPFERNARLTGWDWPVVLLGIVLVIFSVVAAIDEMGA
ncbi:DUF4234 domain-containing protein [Diaphorobacter ruginosibacter]|uniref:DUF4234 domain-containing protein n=1 Tax=Diaphorobacter ruginosibacter TaxID=1715720 RepID=A0A7G9RN83_9BURK|nr:DUF4234 domain-containing protein [Diaphorobacter ruginosibacter]QNN57058.1 DUF4234 domain-containing protein [Diaphorobacter ruginosibacter]